LSLVLAIEPDTKQASILKRIVRERAHAEITVVDTKDAAIAAISAHPPDLILVTALLSPRDEEELVAHLRTLGDESDHLQTITIPLLAPALGSGEDEDGFFKKTFGKRKRRSEKNSVGCDPWTFADQVAGYLKAATEARAARQAQLEYAQRHAIPVDEIQPLPAEETSGAAASIVAEAEQVVEPLVPEPAFGDTEPLFIQPEPVAEPTPAYAEETRYSAPEPVAEQPAYESVIKAAEPEPLVMPEPEPMLAAESIILPEAVTTPEAVVIPEPDIAPEPVVIPEPAVMSEPVAPEPAVAAAPSFPVYETPPERVFEAVVEHPAKKKAKSKKQQKTAAKAPKIHLVPPPEPEAEPAPPPARVFKPLRRLPPLATWARTDNLAMPAPEPLAAAPTSDDNLADLFASLRVPPHVLPVGYPHRPHLRRVRAA
jgi:hypothetical protein